MIPYLTETQAQLRHEVRRFLRDRSPIAVTRQAMTGDLGYDAEVWRQLSGPLGLVGLVVGAEHDGVGPAFVELAIVMEELGYAGTGGPFLPTVLAGYALQTLGDDEECDSLLRQLAAGELRATVGLADDRGSWITPGATVTATGSAEAGWQLSGYSAFVLEGRAADQLVVAARVDGVGALFVVEVNAPGVERCECPSLDQTRRLARITLEQSPARLVSALGVEPDWARLLDVAAVLLAAEQLGGARACLDMAVQYAKDREQFGRPIGSYQAIKHKCADMLVKVDAATSAVFYASRLIGTSDEVELPAVASLAKAYCSDAFFAVAAENIQVHGGIGFTWEHDAHLYFKRATCSRLLLGDPDSHRELMLQSLGI